MVLAFNPRLAALSLRRTLRSSSGAFDLPSVLVGVVVVMVLVVGTLATTIGVIPWIQDNGARQDLTTLTSAQGVNRAQNDRYAPLDALKITGQISTGPSAIAAETDSQGKCFVGVTKSGTGKVLANSDARPDAFELQADTAVGCVSRPVLKSMVDGVGGLSSGSILTGPVYKSISWSPKTSYTANTAFAYMEGSADMSTIAASVYGEYLYLSTDSGATLNQLTSLGQRSWGAVDVSDDGSRIVAMSVAYQRINVHTSTDRGATWTLKSAFHSEYITDWPVVALAPNGTELIAGGDNKALFRSTDFGTTWTQLTSAGTGSWKKVKYTSDGATIMAARSTTMYTSTDSGTSWTTKTLPATVSSFTSDQDGSELYLTNDNGATTRAWTSSDSGSTWTQRSFPAAAATTVAQSADNMTLVTGNENGSGVFISTDGGVTWNTHTNPPENGSLWHQAAISADGTKVVMANGTGIWVGTEGQ